jgi:outer membrane protein OmpA-like peptidoglycan-associated protein
MKRLMLRGVALLALVFLLVPPGFSKSPAKSKTKKASKSTDDTIAAASDTKAEDTTIPAAPAPDAAPVPAQQPAGNKTAANDEYKPAPNFIPMPATTGTLGLFTTETADTLPQGGFAFSVFGNKFGRMPGSVTIFQLGLDASYGITDRFTLYGSFATYQHEHIGCGPQLSMAPPNNGGALYPDTIYHTLVADTLCDSVTPTAPFPPTPGYVEDFPFAAQNTGGIGNFTIGVKYGLLSERHGDPLSLSLRNDLMIATRSQLVDLLGNGTQGSPLSDLVSFAVSKQWSNVVTATFNAGYEFTRDPRSGGTPVFHVADQFRTGAGLLFFPESRFQPMTEYTAVIFSGVDRLTQPDTTFGARDPVDGVWGLRMYPMKNVAVDLGYRYMLNLKDLNDRSGFVVKVGATYWPEKAPPVNHSPTASCSADKSLVYVDSGDIVTVTATAADPDNDPLTYTWTSNGGRVDGTGPQVRWLSAGTAAGTYIVTLHVDDGRGGSASCTADIHVEPKPNHPPTITCSASPSSVFAGERSHITCNASDPDGDSLTYTWRANAGQITGNGPSGDFDTTGLSPGTYSVTTRVDDGRGGAADASTPIEVKQTPPPPQASKINECAFGRSLSTRIDNVCKRILDDAALRLENEPRATAVIIGYSDPRERRPEKIAVDRATNAVKYLGDKGIDASRVSARTGTGQAGATNNRRIDIIFVPEGATY